jgi:hypothetical protein
MLNSAPCLKTISPSLSSAPHSPLSIEFLTVTDSGKRGLKCNIISASFLCRWDIDGHCKLIENLQTQSRMTIILLSCTSHKLPHIFSVNLCFTNSFQDVASTFFCPWRIHPTFFVHYFCVVISWLFAVQIYQNFQNPLVTESNFL